MKTKTKHWAGITAGILSLAGYAPAASLGSEKYTYDASGNIIVKSIDGVVIKMAYDQANRLIGRVTDGQGKQSTAYDAAGRSVTERDADGQTTRKLSYGYGDKVLKTQTQVSKAGFYYNAEGQLVGKQTDGTVSTYTWDSNVLAAEGTEAFANEAHISGGIPVLASGTDVVVSDHLGNTLASGPMQLTGNAYGQGLEKGRLTGKPYVAEMGSYVFRCRNYSPHESRWTTADPSGFPDGSNRYVYAFDPISFLDPNGTEIELWFDGQKRNIAYQSRDGMWDFSEDHSFGATGFERQFFAWADFSQNRSYATPSKLSFHIFGIGEDAYPWLTDYTAEVDYSLEIDEYPDGNLAYNPVSDPDDQSGILKAAVQVSASEQYKPVLTFTCWGGTGLKQTNVSGFGITPGNGGLSINFTGFTEWSHTYGLGTYIYKSVEN
jgi:RHS repeat-associated protein